MITLNALSSSLNLIPPTAYIPNLKEASGIQEAVGPTITLKTASFATFKTVSRECSITVDPVIIMISESSIYSRLRVKKAFCTC